MNVTINGWNCQMSVREFAELAAMMKKPEPAPEPPKQTSDELFRETEIATERKKKANFRKVAEIGFYDGTVRHFSHLRDVAGYFPELAGKDYRKLSFYAPGSHGGTMEDYVAAQAKLLWAAVAPGHRFVRFSRLTTDGKTITARIDALGNCTTETTDMPF